VWCKWRERSYTPWIRNKEWTYKVFHGTGSNDFNFVYAPYGIISNASLKRARLYDDALRDARDSGAHTNESCSSCDESISVDDWFCYCGLCPDCFLNSDSEEDIDNWLGEKRPEL